MRSLAERLAELDRTSIDEISRSLIVVSPDNFVERPWAGQALGRYKSVPIDGIVRFGECFELCADRRDAEAAGHPSRVVLADGSTIDLPNLLGLAPEQLLGAAITAKHGANLPLLPKTLSVAELLSIQAHPPGYTEAYIILDADPGATIFLGFRCDVDRARLAARFADGRKMQCDLLAQFDVANAGERLQSLLSGYFADPTVDADTAAQTLCSAFDEATSATVIKSTLVELKQIYWEALETMNRLEVMSGDVIHNATPLRLHQTSAPRSAEIHALGNPEGREILALEVRKPATTYRAWDNVRFPLRPLAIDDTLGAVNLRQTQRDDFFVEPKPIEPGVSASIDDPSFSVHHLRPDGFAVVRPSSPIARTLHAVAGELTLSTAGDRPLGTLRQGQSALLPPGVGQYTVCGTNAELIEVTPRP
ncbi:MAG: hypothetical protein H6707_17455 [Deltaproteobacteria bacterium]|nr:hypothetical protein [Deltaproteobacteria bacterium]